MSTKAPVIVTVTRHYDASPQQVFNTLLDPAKARRFMFATETGKMVRAEIDPYVGGKYAFVERREGEDVEHVGEYLVIDRPRHLAFTLSVPKYSNNTSRVDIRITPQDTGGELTLTHEIRPDMAQFRDQVEQGWGMILDAMAKTLL